MRGDNHSIMTHHGVSTGLVNRLNVLDAHCIPITIGKVPDTDTWHTRFSITVKQGQLHTIDGEQNHRQGLGSQCT